MTWTACSDQLPECGDPYSAMSGWSKWLQCMNDAAVTDDGPAVFTASYSRVLHRWHRIGNVPIIVTHWQPLPEPPETNEKDTK